MEKETREELKEMIRRTKKRLGYAEKRVAIIKKDLETLEKLERDA